MKRQYLSPSLKVIYFTTEKILATSTNIGVRDKVSRQSQLSNRSSYNKGPWAEDE